MPGLLTVVLGLAFVGGTHLDLVVHHGLQGCGQHEAHHEDGHADEGRDHGHACAALGARSVFEGPVLRASPLIPADPNARASAPSPPLVPGRTASGLSPPA